MTEEISNEVVVHEVDADIDTTDNQGDNNSEAENTSVATSSKYDDAARSQGWVPKEEWSGDPEDWTDAKEFVRRGELFTKISSQSGEIKEMRKAMAALTDHHQKVKETEFKHALEYLKQQKKTALEEGDADKLLAVDEAIDTLKEEKQKEQAEVKAQPKSNIPTQVFVGWIQNNPWYVADNELRAFADDVGVGYFNRNPGVAEEELYNLVAARVKKAFPEKFKGQGNKNQTVESGRSSAAPKAGNNYKLSSEEEQIMKTFVRQGVMTKEQYINDLRKIKGE